MTERRPRLVLFPGLGMDGRTFGPQREGIGGVEIEVPGWLRPGVGETLESYSRRMAGEVKLGRSGGALYLGGVSIGGAIALEVARHVACDGVFLIASARTSRALPHLLRVLGMAGPWVPGFVVGWVARRIAPGIVRWLMRKYPAARAILPEAVRELDVEQWRWGARAVMTWEFGGKLSCPVWQIHGDRDAVTPVYRVEPDEVVRGGGHMLNVTHPVEVNEFIDKRISRSIV